MTGLGWKKLYIAGGSAALLTLLTALAEILITFLPGGYTSADTVVDWFAKSNQSIASLALIVSLIGAAVFYATNRAFPMLALSTQYAASGAGTQRVVLEAAGRAMLSVGQNHTPGAFLVFFFSDIGGILMGWVMLRGRIFNRGAAFAGMVDFSFLFVFEILSSFAPSSHDAVLVLALIGGLANMVWYVLVGLRLFQLGLVNNR